MWFALRHGSVTIRERDGLPINQLWFALRHGSVTIVIKAFTDRMIVVVCSQARISYNCEFSESAERSVVVCSQARISYNFRVRWVSRSRVVVCSQARISYNCSAFSMAAGSVVVCSQARISYNPIHSGAQDYPCCGLLSGTDQLQSDGSD